MSRTSRLDTFVVPYTRWVLRWRWPIVMATLLVTLFIGGCSTLDGYAVLKHISLLDLIHRHPGDEQLLDAGARQDVVGDLGDGFRREGVAYGGLGLLKDDRHAILDVAPDGAGRRGVAVEGVEQRARLDGIVHVSQGNLLGGAGQGGAAVGAGLRMHQPGLAQRAQDPADHDRIGVDTPGHIARLDLASDGEHSQEMHGDGETAAGVHGGHDFVCNSCCYE